MHWLQNIYLLYIFTVCHGTLNAYFLYILYIPVVKCCHINFSSEAWQSSVFTVCGLEIYSIDRQIDLNRCNAILYNTKSLVYIVLFYFLAFEGTNEDEVQTGGFFN